MSHKQTFTFTLTSLCYTEMYVSRWNTPKDQREMGGMAEGERSSHRLRRAGAVPECIGLHVLMNDSQAAHTDGGQQRYFYSGQLIGAEVKDPSALWDDKERRGHFHLRGD